MSHRNHLSPPQFPTTWASSWGEDRFGLWMTLNYKGVELTFRWIPPGSFMMGSPEDETERLDFEDQHNVTLKQGFWLADAPVTQALWKAVTGGDPSYFKGDDLPIEGVNWNDTQFFIEIINSLHPDLSMALPYDSEWEYACRAGTETIFNFGDEIDPTKLNYASEDAPEKTTAIKSYPPNDWGLYDMHGNVYEWCQDQWQEHLGKNAIVIDTAQAQETSETGRNQPEEDGARVVRGGTWSNLGKGCRSACRAGLKPSVSFNPDGRFNCVGFRLVFRSCKSGIAKD